jgi:hypothetical protein
MYGHQKITKIEIRGEMWGNVSERMVVQVKTSGKQSSCCRINMYVDRIPQDLMPQWQGERYNLSGSRSCWSCYSLAIMVQEDWFGSGVQVRLH